MYQVTEQQELVLHSKSTQKQRDHGTSLVIQTYLFDKERPLRVAIFVNVQLAFQQMDKCLNQQMAKHPVECRGIIIGINAVKSKRAIFIVENLKQFLPSLFIVKLRNQLQITTSNDLT